MSQGHKQVSDAISMLRLRFGEPVRLKFLVGMLNSYNSSAFHISCLRFLNRFVETAKDTREKILIQTELEEAGFDLLPLKKMLLQGSMDSQSRWEIIFLKDLYIVVYLFMFWGSKHFDIIYINLRVSEKKYYETFISSLNS